MVNVYKVLSENISSAVSVGGKSCVLQHMYVDSGHPPIVAVSL